MIFDDDGKFLSARDIMKLANTPDGQRKIFEWLTRARAAFAAQRVMKDWTLFRTRKHKERYA